MVHLSKLIQYLLSEYAEIGKKQYLFDWDDREERLEEARRTGRKVDKAPEEFRNAYYCVDPHYCVYPPIAANKLQTERLYDEMDRRASDGHLYTSPIKRLKAMIDIINDFVTESTNKINKHPDRNIVLNIKPDMEINGKSLTDYKADDLYQLGYGENDLLVTEQDRIINQTSRDNLHEMIKQEKIKNPDYEIEIEDDDPNEKVNYEFIMYKITGETWTDGEEITYEKCMNQDKKLLLHLIIETMKKIHLLKMITPNYYDVNNHTSDRNSYIFMYDDHQYILERTANETRDRKREIETTYLDIVKENMREMNKLYKYILNNINENEKKMKKPPRGVITWLEAEMSRLKAVHRANSAAREKQRREEREPPRPPQQSVIEPNLNVPSQTTAPTSQTTAPTS